VKRLHLVEAGSAEAEATRVALPEHVQLSLVGIAESAKEGTDGARGRRRAREALDELLSRDLSELELAVVMIDGIELAGMTHVVALGITSDGTKVPLSLREGSTENAIVATALLSDLVDRGLRRCSAAIATRNVMKKGLAPAQTAALVEIRKEALMEQYVGLDWAYRRARWCAKAPDGAVLAEDWAPADEDGLARLVARLGPDVTACVEMMSGAAWVRDRLEAAGWTVQVADAQGQGGRVAGGQDRQARRPRAGRAGAPRPGARGVGAVVRRPRAQGAPRAAHAPGAAEDLGDQPGPWRAHAVRDPAGVRSAAPARRR